MGKYTGAEPGNSTDSLPGTEEDVDGQRLTDSHKHTHRHSHLRVLWQGQHPQLTHAPLALTKVTWWMGWMGSCGLSQCRPPQRQVSQRVAPAVIFSSHKSGSDGCALSTPFCLPHHILWLFSLWSLKRRPQTWSCHQLWTDLFAPQGHQCSLTDPEARKQFSCGW